MTLGTGTIVNVNVGTKGLSFSEHGLFPLVGWKIGDETTFIMEGNGKVGGNLMEWGTSMKFWENPSKSEDVVKNHSIKKDDVVFAPGNFKLNFKLFQILFFFNSTLQ